MTVTDVNAVLAVTVVVGGAMSLATWVSPRALNWLVTRLYARSVALSAARMAYREAWVSARTNARGGE